MRKGSVALRVPLLGPVRAKRRPLPNSGPAYRKASLTTCHLSLPGIVTRCPPHPPLTACPQGFTISRVLLEFLEVDFRFLEDERPCS